MWDKDIQKINFDYWKLWFVVKWKSWNSITWTTSWALCWPWFYLNEELGLYRQVNAFPPLMWSCFNSSWYPWVEFIFGSFLVVGSFFSTFNHFPYIITSLKPVVPNSNSILTFSLKATRRLFSFQSFYITVQKLYIFLNWWVQTYMYYFIFLSSLN